MRILLISAPMFIRAYLPPLGLGYLAAVARGRGHTVQILSLTNRPSPTLSQIVRVAESFQPEVIGHTVLSPSFHSTQLIFHALARALPRAVLVAGGPHATALPDHTLRATGAHYAVIGEGENTFAELLKALENGENPEGIPGLAVRVDGETRVGSARAFESDVNRFPLPAWDLLKPEAYPQAPPQALQLRSPATQLLTSRGCPYACSYCASFRTMARDFRPRNIDLVMGEIKRLQRDHGIRELMLLDLNFTYRREHAMAFCDGLRRHGIDIAWKPLAGFRIDAVDDELLRTMKQAGCYQLIFGIESFHPDTLAQINKDLNANIVHDQIRLIRRYGFFVASFFIVGSPGETEERIQYSARQAARSGLDFAAFFCWTPLPGAGDWSFLQDKIDLDSFRWESLNYDEAIFSDTLSKKTLTRLLRLAHLRFYSRPKRWWKMVQLIRPAKLRYFLEFAYDYLSGSRGRPRLRP
jgi:radical SAM superfamily enzyme YgiQ (UPF0313 family)